MKLNLATPLTLIFLLFNSCEIEDTTDPNLSWISPENESTQSDTITIMVNASDDVGIEKVELYYRTIVDSPLVNDSVFIDNMLLSSEGQYVYYWDTDIENIPNKDYQLFCIAYDLSGNKRFINNRIITLFNIVEVRFFNDTYEDLILDFANSFFQFITSQESKIIEIEKNFGIANFNGVLNSNGENINLDYDILIENCKCSATLVGNYGGGIVGEYFCSNTGCDCIIRQCACDVKTLGEGAGGICGRYAGSNGKLRIEYCASSVTTTSDNSGGIVGSMSGSDATDTYLFIFNSYSKINETLNKNSGGIMTTWQNKDVINVNLIIFSMF